MSYRQLPGRQPDPPAGPPPGWYPDPEVRGGMRWWDGARWGLQTHPQPAYQQLPYQQPPLPQYPDAASAPGSYGAFRPGNAGPPARPGGPQDGTAYRPGPASGSYPALLPPGRPQPDPYQPQPDPYQPQPPPGPYQTQGWPQQPASAPGPQPRADRAARRRGKRQGRRALIGLGALVVVIAAGASLVILLKSSPGGNLAATSTASAAASTATPSAATPSAAGSSPADCRSQAVSWRDNGGLSQLDAVTTAMLNVQKAATALANGLWPGGPASQDEAALQSAAAALRADAQTAQANLPPSCVPHLRSDEGAALGDASKSAVDCENAVSELRSGNAGAATGDINAANAAVTASGNKFQAAAADVQAFNNG
jgi:hypothetical protein